MKKISFPADIYCSAAAIKALKNTNGNFENTLSQQYYDILSICSELPETVIWIQGSGGFAAGFRVGRLCRSLKGDFYYG